MTHKDGHMRHRLVQKPAYFRDGAQSNSRSQLLFHCQRPTKRLQLSQCGLKELRLSRGNHSFCIVIVSSVKRDLHRWLETSHETTLDKDSTWIKALLDPLHQRKVRTNWSPDINLAL